MPNYNKYPVSGMPTINTMTTTEISTAANNTSETALAANDDRLYALLQNDSTVVMYIALGQTAVQHEGIRLAASGGSYEITWANLYHGAINVICANSGKILMITEGD